jgi:hypothetical protein
MKPEDVKRASILMRAFEQFERMDAELDKCVSRNYDFRGMSISVGAISEADAIAEGILRGDPIPLVPDSLGTIWHDGVTDQIDGWTRDSRQAYRTLWEVLYGPDAWAANPWVLAISFTVERRNIDAAVTA